MMFSVFYKVRNIVGKGEDAGYQHFLLSPWCFQNFSFSLLLKVRIVWQRVKKMLAMSLYKILIQIVLGLNLNQRKNGIVHD